MAMPNASLDQHDAAANARDDAVDATRCPLCDGPNFCAMAQGAVDEPCWCSQIEFAPRVLAALPAHERGRRCICPACAVQR